MKKNHYLAILLFLLSTVIYAMPPHPDVIQEYKKNGTLPLLSSRMAADSRAGMNVSSKSFPLFGSRKVLVLLAGFTDQPFDGGSTPAFYSQLFTGIDDNALSWKKYYKDMSNGQLILEFDIYNVGTVDEDLAYYGANSASDDMDIRPREFVSEVVALGDSVVNYRDYDNDGDGYVDTVIIIHSGAGEEIGSLVGDTSQSDIDNRIWSHQWGITPTLYDDVYVSSYAIQPEFVETAGDSSIGVFVHEFGHVLGLPDLYDTSYESDGIGDWGLMAGGAWAGPSGNGSQPVPLSAWSRMQLGWISVEDLNYSHALVLAPLPWNKILRNLLILSGLSALLMVKLKNKQRLIPLVILSSLLFSTCGDKGTLSRKSLADIETSHQAGAVDIGTGEYIIMENKARIENTWTEYLPGSGLLLMHIDDNLIAERIRDNAVNDYSLTGSKLGVKVIEADERDELLNGDDNDYGSFTDLFSGKTRHALTGYLNNAGSFGGIELSHIGMPGSTMTFDMYVEK